MHADVIYSVKNELDGGTNSSDMLAEAQLRA